ncbi:OmpA family protein [Aquirufa ecclesiirivi]|uniref:OmpA family protein n=1 Tax=Aquirufa ecclesiirivi TaxID=2715124 RepID=UPI003BAEE488
MMSKTIFLQVKSSLALLALLFATAPLLAQKTERSKPKWYFGQSVGINYNYYRGYTQRLNESTLVPSPFRTGEGIKPYASLSIEYDPYKNWGILLNMAYDNRGGGFKDVLAPCNCPASLSTDLSYIALEPSLKVVPFGGSFYIFGGPTYLFNITKGFTYQQQFQAEVNSNFSQVRDNLFAAQIGAGFDIPLSAKNNLTQIVLSPFTSFQTDLGLTPRVDQSWSIYSIRFGMALKMGSIKKASFSSSPKNSNIAYFSREIVNKKEVQFSVRAPKIIPPVRHVKEVLPLRNSIFFDMGSTEIPARYRLINEKEAQDFKESQMVQNEPAYLGEGRSNRQMFVYHHILNITGDRMRTYPSSTIFLVGAADNNPAEGKIMAEKVKNYLMTVFHIDSSRIAVEGRALPLIPSEQKGGVRELDLLHEGDRRVDIVSLSSPLLEPVGNSTNRDLKYIDMVAIQNDPLDSHVILTNLNASTLLNSWSIQLTDEKGVTQNFGPYTQDKASIPGKTILGNNAFGNYKIVMNGVNKDGSKVTKDSYVSLRKADDGKNENGYRFSILFEFDQSKSIATYEQFLTKVVGPYLTDNSTVTIHGHTDIIGEESYNQKLSEERAVSVQKILEKYLKDQPNRRVKFEAFGFGEQEAFSPFDNKYPEERFYNRCVIIDIVPTN